MSQVPPAGQNPNPRRRRFAPAALVAGVAATGALALATTGTLSAFTAQIQNTVDTAASGSLTMQEIGTAATCNSTDAGTGTPANSVNTNTATCATINKYGGSTTLVPGGTASTTTVTLKNTGTVAANTFTMAYGACTPSNNTASANPSGTGNLCDQLTVAVTTGSAPGTAVPAASGTATSLAAKTVTLPAPVAPGASVVFNFSVSIPLAADNTYQNRAASQPITWTFTA